MVAVGVVGGGCWNSGWKIAVFFSANYDEVGKKAYETSNISLGPPGGSEQNSHQNGTHH